ncbi:sulfatase [Streptomyces boluensis]|uniref:Sulfatase n=1 Tax=Streptomyces boluensis TaxID=1775135 RepID=A0A964XK46_9ACTN|nr:sulfatase [Streptomyces boluensis]NBE50332.1 sulfatase [Streptomyces boluensis]
MSSANLRLLPWSSADGKPCYLSTDDPLSTLSRLADDLEEEQLTCGEDVLEGAAAVLADPVAGERAVRFALSQAVASLREVLRVAVSRGGRIESGAVVPDQGIDQA